jgi:hypothetical protein
MWHTDIDPEMQKCIDACLSCSAICTETITHCLRMGGLHAEPGHIALLQLCAATCDLAAKSMQLNSPYHRAFCRLCADICGDCANECESLGADDLMLDCARVCRECAESCAAMAGSDAPAMIG